MHYAMSIALLLDTTMATATAGLPPGAKKLMFEDGAEEVVDTLT